MKKLILYFLLATVLAPIGFGQRMIKGDKFVSLKAGTPFYKGTNAPFRAAIEGGLFRDNGHYFSAFAGYESLSLKRNDFMIPVQRFSFGVAYNLLLINDPQAIFNLYFKGGISVGYEMANNLNNTLPDGSKLQLLSKVPYGGDVDLHCDVYIIDQLAFTVAGGLSIYIDTMLPRFTPYVMGGLVYHF